MNGVALIEAERIRQVEAEGWTPQHDLHHLPGELAAAAIAYITGNREYWPWGKEGFKSKTYKENLVRAGALIAAEIDRISQ